MKCLCCCVSTSSLPNQRLDENDIFDASTGTDVASNSIDKTIRQKVPQWETPAPAFSRHEMPTLHPKPYTDCANKEWLFFLTKEDPSSSSLNTTSSYLYDINNDTYVPFIENYKDKFQTLEHLHDHKINNKYQFGDYIIDNKNHVMYVLECRNGLMIKISISNLHDIKVIDSTLIENQLPLLTHHRIKMVLSNDTKLIHVVVYLIHQIAQHFIFDTQTGICNFIEDNIAKLQSKDFLNDYNKVIDHQKRSVGINNHDGKIAIDIGLQIGEMIDARDYYKQGTYYLAKIVDIKPKNSKDLSKDKKLQRQLAKGTIASSLVEKYRNSLGVLIHFDGWDDRWNEWIYIDNNNNNNETLCNCIGLCHVTKKYHRIAPANTQSMINKQIEKDWQKGGRKLPLAGSIVYSDNKKRKVKIFKPDLDWKVSSNSSGIRKHMSTLLGYHIYQRHGDCDNYTMKLLVNGYIQKMENKWRIGIPVELCNIISKYCNYREWYMDSYNCVYDDDDDDKKSIANGNDTDVGISNNGIKISMKRYFVYVESDDYNMIVILDALNGVYVLDLNRNMIFYSMKKDEIFDPSIQDDGKSIIYAVATQKSKQIHIFVDNQHFSVPISAFVSCLSTALGVNALSFSKNKKG